MKIRIAFGTIAMMFIMSLPVNADGKGEIQKYYSNMASKVKATNDPVEKREILNKSFSKMSKALGIVQSMPFISKNDREGINYLETKLQEKQEELAGTNGFTRVPDNQLNAFADYVVQDSEQAFVITISLVALLLIVIIILLLI